MSRLPSNPVDIAVPELRLENRVRELQSRLKALEAPPDRWHGIGTSGEPTFGAGWGHYGYPFCYPGFIRLNGIVYLKGLLAKPGYAAISNEGIFTLPVGYRPIERYLFTTQSAGGYARIDVDTDGSVYMTFGHGSWTAIDGCIFPAAY